MKKYFIVAGLLLLLAVLVFSGMLYALLWHPEFIRIEVVNMGEAIYALICYLLAMIIIGVVVVLCGHDYYQDVIQEIYKHKQTL